jgi:hypothetical protein
MSAAEDREAVWTWSQPDRRRPDSLHARWDGEALVVIVRGSAEGSVAAGQGGVRLPRQVAAALARFAADPAMAAAPGYWQNETSGVLRPAVERYLRGGVLTAAEIATLRAYLRQWIMAPAWKGAGVLALRGRIDTLTSREAIAVWLADAAALGIDPL